MTKLENIVPKHISEIFNKKHNLYPCFIQTRNVTLEAINVLTKKNKIIWFNKIHSDNQFYIKQALIDYSSVYKIMVFVDAKDNEKIYKLIILCSEDNGTNVDLLIKGLNKFYTIDGI
jgi:hypothetical protein